MGPGRVLATALLAFSGAAAAQPADPLSIPRITSEAADRWVVHVPPVDLPPGVPPSGEMGSVEMRYAPVSGGKVTQCEVTRSSGVAALDAESCRILLERGYIPARSWPTSGLMRFEWFRGGSPWARRGGPLPLDFDGADRINGRAIDYTSGWERSTALAAAMDQGPARWRITVSDQGRSLGCRVTSGRAGARRYARYECGRMRNFIPASDGAGGTRRSFYSGISQVRRRPGSP
jgi:hypothetical protein